MGCYIVCCIQGRRTEEALLNKHCLLQIPPFAIFPLHLFGGSRATASASTHGFKSAGIQHSSSVLLSSGPLGASQESCTLLTVQATGLAMQSQSGEYSYLTLLLCDAYLYLKTKEFSWKFLKWLETLYHFIIKIMTFIPGYSLDNFTMRFSFPESHNRLLL